MNLVLVNAISLGTHFSRNTIPVVPYQKPHQRYIYELSQIEEDSTDVSTSDPLNGTTATIAGSAGYFSLNLSQATYPHLLSFSVMESTYSSTILSVSCHLLIPLIFRRSD